MQFEEQSQRIAELEAQLNNVQLERDSNVAAAEILTQMIRTGDAEQDEHGAIVVSKSKFGHTNIVGNEEDF